MQPAQNNLTKKPQKLLFIIAIAVLIIALGIGIYFYLKNNRSQKSQPISQPPTSTIEQPIFIQPPATGDKNNQTQEEFCGSSSKAQCGANEDCAAGGCSRQICAGKNEESPISTCEFRACYDAVKYNLQCQCVQNQCQWK